MYHENSKHRKAGVAILTSKKADFKAKHIARDKETFPNKRVFSSQRHYQS